MARVIRRYANRKLYDPDRKGYVSLDEVAETVQRGEEVRIVENETGNDITSQTLARVLAKPPQAQPASSAEFLHQMVRWSGQMLTTGIGQAERQLDRLVEAALVRAGRTGEVAALRARVDQLEAALARLEEQSKAKRAPRKRAAAKKSTSSPRSKKGVKP